MRGQLYSLNCDPKSLEADAVEAKANFCKSESPRALLSTPSPPTHPLRSLLHFTTLWSLGASRRLFENMTTVYDKSGEKHDFKDMSPLKSVSRPNNRLLLIQLASFQIGGRGVCAADLAQGRAELDLPDRHSNVVQLDRALQCNEEQAVEGGQEKSRARFRSQHCSLFQQFVSTEAFNQELSAEHHSHLARTRHACNSLLKWDYEDLLLSFMSFFVLTTTENYPDVTYGFQLIYNSGFVAIYMTYGLAPFGTCFRVWLRLGRYIMFTMILMISILLAVNYQSFIVLKKEHYVKRRFEQRQVLLEAFKILQDPVSLGIDQTRFQVSPSRHATVRPESLLATPSPIAQDLPPETRSLKAWSLRR